MDLQGKHIAILIDNYFEQAEFEEPLSHLKNAGAEVTVVSTGEKTVTGMHHADKGDSFSVDLTLSVASSDDYDALVLPGGAINADTLRMNPDAQQFVADFINSNRPLAVICHAPWLLVSADCIEGRRLTSYHTIQDDIRNAGAEWVDSPVVIDNNLITSRNPDDLPQFNAAIVNMLKRKTTVASAAVADMPYIGSEQEMEDELRLRSLGYSQDKDELDRQAEKDILLDEDQDPDAFYSSRSVSQDEQDSAD